MTSHCHNEGGECGAATDRGACDHDAIKHRTPADSDIDAGQQRRTVFDVSGLCCQSEVALIEDSLATIDGIDDYAINIAAGTLSIYHDGDEERVDTVVEGLKKVGLKADIRRSVGRQVSGDDGPYSAHFWVIVAGVMLSAVAAVLRYSLAMQMASAMVFAAAIAVGGFFVFRQALAGLRRRQFNIPILVTIAVVGAGVIGEWFEAATVIILFAFAEWLESRSMARARREIGALMRLGPQVAMRLDDDGNSHEVEVDAIEIGDRIRVRPGAKIPVDAVIEQGRTEVDESAITGESIPVLKGPGDTVYSGTVNGAGVITLEATQPASRSTLAHIIDAIEEARANQSPTEQFIDRFARIYTPAVVAAAAVVALGPPLVMGAAWIDWFYRALVFLVIACPCALVISTPIANVAGLARAARAGVLVKGGKFLELLGRLQAVAFDKTGTLTRGRPEVEEILALDELDQDGVLLVAARAEADSEHHVGRAIVDAARHRWTPADFIDRAHSANASVGRGIEASIDLDGIDIAADESMPARVGRVPWLTNTGVQISAEIETRAQAMQTGGRTVIGVALGERLLGLIALRDALRPQATSAVSKLRTLGISHLYLITGDNEATAQAIGRELGFADRSVWAGLLPDEKVRRIEMLRRRHDPIAMVGDGVNDAPALAGATVGVAMGAAGTDVALESADVALMGDDLDRLSQVVEIGRKTTRVIYQNIAVALGLKAIFLVLAVLGIATLWMAIVADMGASLIVIFNAIRLLRHDGHSQEQVIRSPDPKPQVAKAS